jgi:hypothetical protein
MLNPVMVVRGSASVPALSLSRTTLGRLAATAQTIWVVSGINTAFSVSEWTGYSGTGTVTLSVVSDILRATLNAGSGYRGAFYNALALPVDHCIISYLRTQTTGGFGGACARTDNASPQLDLILAGAPLGYSGTWGVAEILAGADINNSVSSTSNRTRTLPSQHILWARNNDATYRGISGGGTGLADVTLSIAGLNAGTNGLYGGIYTGSSSSNVFDFEAWLAMRSAILRVEGPNSGTWVIRLRNSSGTLIYTSPTHSGGVVEINAQTEFSTLFSNGLPLMAQIEAYEPATLSVIAGPEVPSERLWGGDIWTLS